MTDRPNAHDALLAATSELTYARGITGTGVDAIAARAGVTKRTLYQHFGSKEQLIAEALSERSRRALSNLEAGARRRSEETGELAILAFFDVIENALGTKTKSGCAFINASLEINYPGHPIREAALAHLRAREELVGQLLVEAGACDQCRTERVWHRTPRGVPLHVRVRAASARHLRHRYDDSRRPNVSLPRVAPHVPARATPCSAS